jgi:hypothetical protein
MLPNRRAKVKSGAEPAAAATRLQLQLPQLPALSLLQLQQRLRQQLRSE